MLAVHVDDMIFAGKNACCDRLNKHINKCFPTKDLVYLTHYSGFSSIRDRSNNYSALSQEAYIDILLKHFKISKSTPLPAAPYADAPRRVEQ